MAPQPFGEGGGRRGGGGGGGGRLLPGAARACSSACTPAFACLPHHFVQAMCFSKYLAARTSQGGGGGQDVSGHSVNGEEIHTLD